MATSIQFMRSAIKHGRMLIVDKNWLPINIGSMRDNWHPKAVIKFFCKTSKHW